MSEGDYAVKDGDCIASIAWDAGHLPETIWDHANNAELKRQRKDPNVLFVGDTVYVPPIRKKQEPSATDQRHRFKVKGVPAKFKIRLLDGEQPRANEPYQLVIEGKKFFGNSDGQGWIEHSIMPSDREGKLILRNGDEVYNLQLGWLDPHTETSGVQARLKCLGFYHGEVNGEESDELTQAVKDYQKSKNLTATGQIDSALTNSLKGEHLS